MINKRKINPYPIHNTDSSSVLLSDHRDSLAIFKDKPFWIWDQQEHNVQFLKTNGQCCFNHIIGKPIKNDKEYDIFPFQKLIFDSIENNQNIWILKSRGIGITTFMIRYLAWKILSTSELDNKSIFIISGTREQHANYIKQKLQELFIKKFPFLQLESKYTELWLKKTWIKVFPTKNVKDVRGYFEASYIWVDESDYLEESIQQELIHAIGPYEEKSNCKIILSSTPFLPNGLMQKIENDSNNKYKKLKLDYTYGLGTIYDKEEIERKKLDVEFKREYECQYGYGLGNVFLPYEIENCCGLYSLPQVNENCSISMGIDPGFGSSNFGITILQLEDNVLKVLYAKEYARPSYEQMISLIGQLRYQFKPNKIYVDGAKPDFIKSLKIQFRENIDYESVIERANTEKIDYEYRMFVIPISFNLYGKELLGRFQHVVSKTWFSVSNEEHKELVTQMRTAKYQDNGNLDKSESGNISTYDVFDSTRLALKMFEMGERR